jgi:hypothetical protein
MVCHACGREVGRSDRFCNGCGASLSGVTDTTQLVTAVAGAAPAAERGSGPTGDAGHDAAQERGRPHGDPGDRTGPDRHDDADERDVDEPDADEPDADEPDADPPVDPSVDPAVDDIWADADPVWAATGAVPVSDAPPPVAGAARVISTDELPSTEPITEVWMASATDVADDVADATVDIATGSLPEVGTTARMPLTPVAVGASGSVGHRFRFSAVTLIGIVTGFVTMAALFATALSVTSTSRLVIGPDAPPEFRTGTWIVDDLAGNLSIAGLIAIVSMVAGGLAAGFGWRWGSGLAGGAGLAVAGLAALAIGLAQVPIDAAKAFALIPPDEPFTLTITRDVGYWLLVAAGALGVVLFFASINDAFGDRRSGLNPWIAALGALATVATAAGPLLPENLAVFSDNWYVVDAAGQPSAVLLAGRLVQIALLVVTGVIGFLSVRRWGLGLAIGGSLPVVWLATSTLFDLTGSPVGPGFRNPGAEDMHLHGVTIIGVSAIAAISVLAVIAAYDQGVRERR